MVDVHSLTSEFVVLNEEKKESKPIAVRTGDFNNDGYADMVVITQDNNQNLHVRILQSIQASVAHGRSFKLMNDGMEQLQFTGSALSAVLIDLNEDVCRILLQGALDIVVTEVVQPLLGAPKITTTVYFNYFQHDAFFLKGLVLNGVCKEWCSEGEKFPDHHYGVSYSGSTFKHTVVDNQGNLRITQSSQLAQTNYMRLSPPRTIIGLGRISNYVQDLYVGVSAWNNHYTTCTGIIPNSDFGTYISSSYRSNPSSS
jgi:integrin alpha FG-GAP repeat containing protein 1